MVAETLWALIIVFAGNDGHGISQPQWGGYHYTNALCQWTGREAVKELTESGRSPSEFECIDGYAERERVAVKWRLAPPEEFVLQWFNRQTVRTAPQNGLSVQCRPRTAVPDSIFAGS